MNTPKNIIDNCKSELKFSTSRSGGSGGQHVNKVETKVLLRWNIRDSLYLDNAQKLLISSKLSRYVNQNGDLILYQQTARSQFKNKEKVVGKWKKLIHEAFYEHKPRRATMPSKKSMEERRRDKENRSKVKRLRRKPEME